MKKVLSILFVFLVIHLDASAQYALEWFKVGKHLIWPTAFQYYNGKLVCHNTFSDTTYYKPVYDGYKIQPIGRLHKTNVGGRLPAFSSSLSINDHDGSLGASMIGENFQFQGYQTGGNGDTLIHFERISSTWDTRDSLRIQVDSLYMQITNSTGNFYEKAIPVTSFGNTNENNGIFARFNVLRTNDRRHIYGLMEVRADSIRIMGKTIVCDRKYSYILCCLDYKGNFLWGFNVCNFDKMYGPGTLITQLCTYQVDEVGTGYFTGFVLRYDVWVLGDLYEFKDTNPQPFPQEETFVIRVSPDGRPLNKKFFNTVRAKFLVNPRFKDRFYFKSQVVFNYNDQYGSNWDYKFNELGYEISGKGKDFTTEIGYVVGEMDTAFHILWYRVLPFKAPYALQINTLDFAGSAFVNEANELIFAASRRDKVELNDTAFLFSDSTGRTFQPVLLKVSEKKNVEPLYSFGYTKPFAQTGYASYPSKFINICEGEKGEVFAVFNPPSFWGIENVYYEYNVGEGDADNYVIFTKIRDTTVVKDSSNAIHEQLLQIPGKVSCKVYPNPASHVLYVTTELKTAARVSLDLYATDGRLVRSIPARTVPMGTYSQALDVESLPKGLYKILIRVNESSYGTQVVKL